MTGYRNALAWGVSHSGRVDGLGSRGGRADGGVLDRHRHRPPDAGFAPSVLVGATASLTSQVVVPLVLSVLVAYVSFGAL